VDYLARSHRPAVVLAASGMWAGGRVVNYPKAMLADVRHDILFVGYQAQGTLGRAIQLYGPRGGYLRLDGESYDIRASVTTIPARWCQMSARTRYSTGGWNPRSNRVCADGQRIVW
jgi:metallo-beta-lactamase family protein